MASGNENALSPPERVIEAASGSLSSPAGETSHVNTQPESVTAKTAGTATGQQMEGTTSVGQGDEIAETGSRASDDENRPTAQKRKAHSSRKSAEAKKPRRTLPAARKSAQDRKWEAPFVYTDSKSPLARADLRVRILCPVSEVPRTPFSDTAPQAILLLPEAWEVLTPEEKQDVLAKFPDETHILDAGTPEARPNLVSLRNDDNFRHDCARYCENLELGRHDEEWLAQAWIAHEKHKRGDFDEFLRRQFEEEWEIALPDDCRPPKAPETANSSRTTGPADPSKQDGAESAEQPQTEPATGSHGGTAEIPDSQQSSPSTQPAVEGSPPQILGDSNESAGQGQSAGAKQEPRSPAAADSLETSQPVESPSAESRDAAASSEEKVADSIVVAQPK